MKSASTAEGSSFLRKRCDQCKSTTEGKNVINSSEWQNAGTQSTRLDDKG